MLNPALTNFKRQTNLFCYKWNSVITNKGESKAGYSASPVACGWAGAVLVKVTRAFGHETEKKIKKLNVTNKPTDQPTDQIVNYKCNQQNIDYA